MILCAAGIGSLCERETVFDSRCISEDHAIQRSEPGLRDLPAFCLRSIEGRPKAHLSRTQILRDLPDAALHVVAAQAQGLAVSCKASQCDMHVRMFGITMGYSNPFQGT